MEEKSTTAVHGGADHSIRQQSEVNGRPIEAVLEDVGFSYASGQQALDGLSFTIGSGRSVAIVGPSGCGKTTLLSLLAGIYAPQRGSISWPNKGNSSPADQSGRHHLSMVFQGDTLLPWQTVVENIELHARFARTRDKAAVRARTNELLEMASLRGFEHLYPYQLSGGMRRRTQFLAAMAPSPEMLLLDEPFSALDEPTRIRIHQDVFNVLRHSQTTMVIATHDLAEALSLCDEIIILSNQPGSVYRRHMVPFGHERNMLELRLQPAFLDLYRTLWADLSNQIRLTPHNPGGGLAAHEQG